MFLVGFYGLDGCLQPVQAAERMTEVTAMNLSCCYSERARLAARQTTGGLAPIGGVHVAGHVSCII